MSYPTTRSIVYLYGKTVRVALSTVLRNVCFVSGLANEASKLKTGLLLALCAPEYVVSCSCTVCQNIWPHIRALCAQTFGIWPHILALCARKFGLTFSLCAPENLSHKVIVVNCSN